MRKRILWVLPALPHVIAEQKNIEGARVGNWVNEMLECIASSGKYDIAIACCANSDNLASHRGKGVDYFILPIVNKTIKKVPQSYCNQVVEEFNPDLIHIWGTEFAIQEQFSRFKVPNIVYVQGLIRACSIYERGELGGSALKGIDFPLTSKLFIEVKKRATTSKRIRHEKALITRAHAFAGRTLWDRAHLFWSRPDARYYVVNEVLRRSFYKSDWDMRQCSRRTIFIGNGYKPLKGLHVALEALGLLKQKYPDIALKVAGVKPIEEGVKKLGYSRVIEKQIEKYDLSDNVTFLGFLDEEAMVEAMLSCGLYLLPSLMENSSNSLGEAQLLGMPCVVSYAGGILDFVEDGSSGLVYRATDAEMLAFQMTRIIESDTLANTLSVNAKKAANIIHANDRCFEELLRAYESELSIGFSSREIFGKHRELKGQ